MPVNDRAIWFAYEPEMPAPQSVASAHSGRDSEIDAAEPSECSVWASSMPAGSAVSTTSELVVGSKILSAVRVMISLAEICRLRCWPNRSLSRNVGPIAIAP